MRYHRHDSTANKAACFAFQRPKFEPLKVFKSGTKALRNDDVDAAIKSAARLFVLGNLHNQAMARHLHDRLTARILTKKIAETSFAFQGPHPSPALTADALEGLFDTLAQRLGQLRDVRTDHPCDYIARCKAGFTDALIHELEARGHHSPAFDRLIQLRDAWDCGQLDLPNVTETTP